MAKKDSVSREEYEFLYLQLTDDNIKWRNRALRAEARLKELEEELKKRDKEKPTLMDAAISQGGDYQYEIAASRTEMPERVVPDGLVIRWPHWEVEYAQLHDVR